MKQQFILNTPDTFRTYVYENNRRLVVDSATITVYRPGSDVKLVDNAQMTVDPDGLLSYALTASHNSELGTNYRAVITYVVASAVNYVTLFYDVVRTRLVKVITDDDIITELPQLKDKGWRVHGTAEGGSVTTIVDSELQRYEDDYFTGGTAYSVDKEETREITGFTSSTGTVTTTAFSSPITFDRYILTRSYSREINRAFEKIEDGLVRLGKRPELVLDPYDLREVHIYYSVAEACKGLSVEQEDFWWEMWQTYTKKAEETFRSINFKYDASGDGYIAGGEERERLGILHAGRR